MQVVVYSQRGQSIGLVVDEILDIVEDTIQVRPSHAGRGLIGLAVIQQRVTDVLDVSGLIRSADPDLVVSPGRAGD
jgi:two-component system, chemotaxis family, sensor kinase CheA